MLSMLMYLQTRLRRDDGATMVEYGLIVAVIAIVALVGAKLVGTNLNTLFSETAADL
jgi:pilus assembly protein Flp/PilA